MVVAQMQNKILAYRVLCACQNRSNAEPCQLSSRVIQIMGADLAWTHQIKPAVDWALWVGGHCAPLAKGQQLHSLWG